MTTDTPSAKVVLMILSFVIHFVMPSGCQTTPFDKFSGVTVTDQTPAIASDTEKRYTTTITLETISVGVEFVPITFANAAAGFYSTALSGFIEVENIQSSTISANVFQVTYDVRYSYPVLFNAVAGDDRRIKNAIGNLNAVKNGLNSIPTILSLYSVLNQDAFFSFDGSSICAFAICNGTYVTCIESIDGISSTCVSNCKNGYCGEDGICFHSDPNVVPSCRCTSLPDLWIIGERCETKFPLWLVFLLSVIGFLIILLVIAAVIICVLRKQRKNKRKEKLLHSVPASYQNQIFANDDARSITILPSANVQPRLNSVNTLERDDSFETISSSQMSPTQYNPHNRDDRRNHAPQDSYGYHHRLRKHSDRHRSSSDSELQVSSDYIRSDKSFSEEPKDLVQATATEISSGETETEEKDSQSLSFYEIEVNDLDMETDAAPNIAAGSSGVKLSPIRWLPTKKDDPRPGWVPSLGPMMYDLPMSKNNVTTERPPRQRKGQADA